MTATVGIAAGTAAIGHGSPGKADAPTGHSSSGDEQDAPRFRDMLGRDVPSRGGPDERETEAPGRHPRGSRTVDASMRDVPPRRETAKEGDAETSEAGAPLRDRFPLMSALHGLRRHMDAGDEATTTPEATPDGTPDRGTTGEVSPSGPLAAQTQQPAPAFMRKATVGSPPSSSAEGRVGATSGMPDAMTAAPGPDLPNEAELLQPNRMTGREGPDRGRDAMQSGTIATRAGALQRANVVAEQSFPAPASYPLSRTVADLTGTIASDPTMRQAASAATWPPNAGPAATASAHTLKIELKPAELGMVTASMRMAGDHLSIEIKPETYEAYRKLSSDSEAIVKSLRGLGFDIDKVTVLQPALATTSAARADATAQAAIPAGRDQPSSNSGTNGGGSGLNGQQSGRNRNDDGHDHGRAGPQLERSAGGSLFI